MELNSVVQVGPHAVTFRPDGENDVELRFKIYASTRTEELAPVPWSPEQKEQFLRQQFRAQDHSYRNNYPGATFWIIVVDGIDAGRLYLHRQPKDIRVMDIALLPDFRRRGIGAALLQQVLAEGDESGRIVSICVEFFNPARRLYERLGFRQVGQTEVYLLLEWHSAKLTTPSLPASANLK